MHAKAHNTARAVVHHDEHPVCPQDRRFASKQVETPQTVLRVTEDREPGRPRRVWVRPVPGGENAPHDILVDGNTEGQGDLLRDSWTTPRRIPLFHLDDGGHHVLAGSLWARLLPDRGREQQAIFPRLQRSMKAQERCGFQDDRGTDQPARAHEEHTHAGDDAISEAEIRCTFPGPIEDQQLLLEEHGFGHDGTRAAGTGESGDCRQQMQKEDGQVAHGTILARWHRPENVRLAIRHAHAAEFLRGKVAAADGQRPLRSRVIFQTLAGQWERDVLSTKDKHSTQKNHRHIMAKHSCHGSVICRSARSRPP